MPEYEAVLEGGEAMSEVRFTGKPPDPPADQEEPVGQRTLRRIVPTATWKWTTTDLEPPAMPSTVAAFHGMIDLV